MNKKPKISIAIPVYDMKNKDFFLKRCLDSIERQTFKDYEVVMTEEGKMAENTNAAMRKCHGDIIKILYMDDYMAHDDALQEIADAWMDDTRWMVTGCSHDPGTHFHLPTYNDDIYKGVNTIGSPSVLSLKNDADLLFFDERLTWLLDCDLYKRLYEKWGPPTILNDINATIGIHDGQTTMTLPDEIKEDEHDYLLTKHA